jgi:hypothetical protein
MKTHYPWPGFLNALSNAVATRLGWDGYANHLAHVDGLITLTGVSAGGYWTSASAAQATFPVDVYFRGSMPFRRQLAVYQNSARGRRNGAVRRSCAL